MAIDWNYLFDVKVEQLNDEKAEDLYTQLIEFNPEDEDNVQRLRKLYEVCKSFMQIKSLQAEVAIEELEESVKKYDKNEIENLRKELNVFKQTDIRGENIGQKISEVNNQILELKNSIEAKESENIRLRRKFNDLQNSLDLKDKEVIALRSEVESLRDEIDNQRQVEEHIVERQEPMVKLREKNKQIQTLLDELREAETMNLELANQVKKLKLELNSATNELQISCNQMEMLFKQINELKQLNEDFLVEKQYLSEENNKYKEVLNKYESGDDNIIDRYTENVRQLQKLVQLKDEEIIKLKSLNLIPNQSIEEKVKRMSKELEEKDKQIDLLKSQLNEAVNDMESQTEIIRKLFHQNRGDEEVSKLNEKVLSLNNQLKNIEEEVLIKDEELLALRKRINNYERGEYGLRDALKEINDLTKHLNNRDQRIEEMVEQINELKLQLNDAEDVIDGLPNVSHKDRHQTDDKTEVSVNAQKLSKREIIKVLELEQQVIKLEDEKMALKERLKLSLNKSIVDKQENKEINCLKERLKSAENENLELQLGMKEILNGIRETDSESDVIIECPSLERVCRLMESRNISEDLTNIIALKAELDLVRGHNEQIRTDMRRLRNDYLKVISQYTQHLLENDFFSGDSKLDYYKDVNQKISNENMMSKEEEEEVSENGIILLDQRDIEREKSKTNVLEEQTNEAIVRQNPLVLTDRETQTMIINDMNEEIETKIVSQSHSYTQTEEMKSQSLIVDNISSTKCKNCAKVMKIIEFLRNCVSKLEENIKLSENKFTQRLQLLQTDNFNLTNSFTKKLNEKEIELMEKESQINLLKNKVMNKELIPSLMAREGISSGEENQLVRAQPNRYRLKSESQPQLSSSCKTVLESVINCLQARLEHKDESIRQYRNMLSEVKQNFENEMIGLIESHSESDQKSSINFTQMIDNEELQSALKSCVNELEICKTQLNSQISDLKNELEIKNAKLMAYQNENEELRHKKTSPNSQLKQLIDQLRDELKQKDSVINSLNKSIKDDRAMRAQSAVRQPRDESIQRERKVDNELFQEIANLRAINDSQKQTIKTLEVVKWDLEKNLKEFKEQMKQKLKQKETEISELNQKLEKMKVRLNKSDNEKQFLQNKVSKRDNIQKNSSNKSIQTYHPNSEQELNKLKNEFKKLKNDFKERESEAKDLRNDLDVCRKTESELKTLLKESVKREKLSTIQEEGREGMEWDKQYDTLLQENARIKVELRMAEFELKRRSAEAP